MQFARAATRPASADRFDVDVLPPSQITDDLVEDWHALESRAVEANAFLSPHFVRPMLQHLTDASTLRLLTVRNRFGRLVGLACFEDRPASRAVPFAHSRTHRCVHSFRGGLLIDGHATDHVIEALLDYLCEADVWAVEFTEQWLDSPVMEAIRRCMESRKATLTERSVYERPVVFAKQVDEAALNEYWSRGRRKAVRKSRRRIQRHGHYEVRGVRDVDEVPDAVERFLKLEDAGWKSDAGTSLLSSPTEAAFFRETVANFAEEGSALFVELCVDGRVVASSANFLSGNALFAFKVGWDPDFADASPGQLLDVELITQPGLIPDHVDLVDGCAKGTSYLGQIWPNRLRIGNALLTLKRRSRLVTNVVDTGRRFKQLLKN